MRTDQTMSTVHSWLEEQATLVEQCTGKQCLDDKEKTYLRNRINDIQRNLGFIQKSLEKGKPHLFCKECGAIEFSTYTNSKDLVGKQLCFHCNFWQEREAIHLAKPNIIVGGMVYSDGGHKPSGKKEYLGHAGREFHILTDDGKEWITNNLWGGGTIPLKYRLTTMKDNARFL